MFSEILFDNNKYQGYEVLGAGKLNQISNLSRINILIGQNNSGKSRFLRTLFADDEFEFLLAKKDNIKLRENVERYIKQIRQLFDDNHIEDADNFLKRLGEIDNKLHYFRKHNTAQIIKNLRDLLTEFSNKQHFSGYNHKPNIITTRDANTLLPQVKTAIIKLSAILDEIFPPHSNFDIHRIYIPILRGLRPTLYDLNGKDDLEFIQGVDNYSRRTIKDYFLKEKDSIKNEIFTGLNLYEDTKRLLLGRKTEREKIKNFEEFLSINFFNGQTISLIPDFNNDVLLIGIGQEEWPVHQLGDGIQSIIIMLYPLFFNQDKNMLVFIEEPENSLHPGMQRIFIEALQRKEFDKFQYFITTHSNHFLDITLDFKNISVYSFSKNFYERKSDPTITIENVNNEQTSLLDLIGVRNSSIFLSNSTIWVEGITDRLYLRKYLDSYQNNLIQKDLLKKKFREDLHFSFLEYGGANIVHYSFSDLESFQAIQSSRISNRILLIVDSDNAEEEGKNAKIERFKKLRRNLKERFVQIDGREIENLLKEDILVQIIAKIEKKKVSELKFDSEKVQQKFYIKEGLGTFIKNNFKGLSKNYEASSGTLKNKLAFCQVAIESINSFDDLSKPAQQLTKKVYDFISSNNS